MIQIIAEHTNIIFQFHEDTTSDRFINTTSSGLIIPSKDVNQSGVARWAKVTHIGEKIEDINVGEYVLLEPGKWTSGFYVEGQRYWKTDVDQILAVSDKPSSTY